MRRQKVHRSRGDVERGESSFLASPPPRSSASSSASYGGQLCTFVVVLCVLLMPTLVFVWRGGFSGDVAASEAQPSMSASAEISKVFSLKNLGGGVGSDDDDDDDDEKVQPVVLATAPAFSDDDDAKPAAPADVVVQAQQQQQRRPVSSSSLAPKRVDYRLPDGSAPKRTVHVVSFSHWDVEWYTGFQFMRRQLLHTIDRVSQAMRDNPSDRFFSLDGQSVVAEDYLELRGAHTQQGALARALLREGRLVTGPLYTQPDEFQASPEAIMRNFYMGTHLATLYGQPPVAASGASRPQVSFLDQFGHVGQLPRMMREHGIDVFFTARGTRGGRQAMLWRGTDGSVVLVAYIVGWYCNGKDMENSVHSWKAPKGVRSSGREAPPAQIVAQLKRAAQQQAAAADAPTQLLIMYGCDHSMPDRHLGAVIDGLNVALNGEGTLVVSSRLADYAGLLVCDLFAAQNVSRIEDLRLEWANAKQANRQARAFGGAGTRQTAAQAERALQQAAPSDAGDGVLPLDMSSGEMRTDVSSLLHTTSSVILQKQDNWRCQTLLERYGEPLQALLWSAHAQHRYENETMWYAWKLAMRNHAHDSIGGCSNEDVHYDVTTRLRQCKRAAGQVAGEALLSMSKLVRALADADGGDAAERRGVPRAVAALDAKSGSLRVVVYNALPYARTELVSASVWLTSGSAPQQPSAFSQRGFVRVVRVAEGAGDGSGDGSGVDEERAAGVRGGSNSGAWAFFIPEKGGFRYPFRGPRCTIAFVARDVPPVGYATYAVMFDADAAGKGAGATTLPLPPLLPAYTTSDDATAPTEPAVVARLGDGPSVLIHVDGSVSMREPLTGAWLRDLNMFGDQHSRGNLYSHAGGSQVRTARDANGRLEVASPAAPVVDNGAWQSVSGLLKFGDVALTVHYVLPYGARQPLRVRVELAKAHNAANHRLTVGFAPPELERPRILADGAWEVRAPFSSGSDPNVLRDFVDVSGQRCRSQTACTTVGVTVAPRGLQEYDVRGGNSVAIAMLRGNDILGDWTSIRVPSGQELDEDHAWEWAVAVHAGSLDPAVDFDAVASGEAAATAPAADDVRRSALDAMWAARGFQAPLVAEQALEWAGLVGLYTPLQLDRTTDYVVHRGVHDPTAGGGQGESVASQALRASPRKPLPPRGSFVRLAPAYLQLSALKKVELRDELLVRFYNPFQTRVRATIDLDLGMLRANHWWRRAAERRVVPRAAADVVVRRCHGNEQLDAARAEPLPHTGAADAARYTHDALDVGAADVVTLCVAFPRRPVRTHLKAYHSGESSEWSERSDE